jgi:excisionase family DNA binding protein
MQRAFKVRDPHLDDDTQDAPATIPFPELLSAETVAALLQVSVRTVWRLRASGRLPRPVQVGGSIRWRADDVRQWIGEGCPLVRA